ncbi:MAG TPA: NADH-quinone oxidoreductase subunit NuoE [Pseudonocardia sp.]|jgi:NADH-quinone oxidoreductase subunit E
MTDQDVPRAMPEMTEPPRPGAEPTVTEIENAFDELTGQRAKAIIGRYPQSRSALLPMLHLVQSVQGYVSQQGIEFCAQQLELSTAEVSAVATFYTMYKRRPGGEHLVSVCTNTLCAALGGDAIYKSLCERLGNGKPLGHEQTAGEPGSTGSITLEHAECLAACDLAPVLQVNYEFFDKQTVETATELVDALRRGEKPDPTRGAPLTDWRTVELEIAGFFSDLAALSDGPSAATETLVGARLAESNGWTAPAMPEHAELPPVPEKK